MKRIIRFVIALVISIPWAFSAAATAVGEYAFNNNPDWEYWRSYHGKVARMLTFREIK